MTFSIYQLKPRFQRLLRPVLAGLVRLHVTPNQVTVAATLLSLAYGAMLAWRPSNWYLWAGLPAFMLLRMALNAVDGMLANFSNLKTRIGAVLNELGDQISDAALALPFALVPGIDASLLVVVALSALLVEFAGVLAVLVGATRRFDGPMGKSDRAFAFGLLAVLIACGAKALWLNGVLMLMLLGLAWTLVNRVRRALQHPVAPPKP